MRKFWRILSNWKRVVKLVGLIKNAAEDKKVTGEEAEAVLKEAIAMLVEMGVISA